MYWLPIVRCSDEVGVNHVQSHTISTTLYEEYKMFLGDRNVAEEIGSESLLPYFHRMISYVGYAILQN
jgi:hypothetical protein